MNRYIANAIAGTALAAAQGTFYRHAWYGTKQLKGSTGGGRWGPEHGFPVIYSVCRSAASSWRPIGASWTPSRGMRGDLVGPRVLLSIEVDVDRLLDLRDANHLAAVGLDQDALRGPWAPCVRVARAAHQLGLHGILAPAATDLGLTLALFEQHLPHDQMPRITGREQWAHLPPDPRSEAQREAQIARAASDSTP